MNTTKRVEEIVRTLKSCVINIPNTWSNKDRELYIFTELLNLNFIVNGNKIKEEKNIKAKLKQTYLGSGKSDTLFGDITKIFPQFKKDDVILIHEPFGSRTSPDFIFISKNKVYGLEDKKSESEKISWNTGTPGGNKFISYYNVKNKTIYLLTPYDWKWDDEIQKEYKKFTQEIIQYGKNKWNSGLGKKLPNMEFYARPMLVDKNKVKDLYKGDDNELKNILSSFLE